MTKGANAQFSSRAAWSAVKLGKPARSAMPCSPSVFSQGATALGRARGRAWQRLPCAWVTANSFRSDKGQRGAPNRKAVTLNSPGSGRAPWESRGRDHIYPEGVVQATPRAALCNRFAVETRLDAGSQVRCATLGSCLQPLRGKYRGRAQDPGVYCATPGCGINPLRGRNRATTLVPNTIAASGAERLLTPTLTSLAESAPSPRRRNPSTAVRPRSA
jgi:hypothetical protein